MRQLFKRLDHKRKIAHITRVMRKRKDPLTWPLRKQKDKQGLEKFEYSLFSQNGEDGILRYLFSEIGFGSRFFLEFGFSVLQNNSLRLILKEQYSGVFIDGSELSVKQFNEAVLLSGTSNVQAITRFLDLDNLESTIMESNLPEDIDMLSIDVDGNDYWFWEGINCISPRIVVIEYNASLGPELSLTVPYDPSFDRHEKHKSGFYAGASIGALEKLGKKKGYSLLACDSMGVNAFFVRDDCMTKALKVSPASLAYQAHKRRLDRGFSLDKQLSIIEDMPFTLVE